MATTTELFDDRDIRVTTFFGGNKRGACITISVDESGKQITISKRQLKQLVDMFGEVFTTWEDD